MAIDVSKYASKLEEQAKPKEQRSANRANRMSISGDAMRGDLIILPVVPDAFNGEPYMIVGDKKCPVREVFIKTKQTNKGEGWGLILPKKFYGDMTPSEEELYDEVVGMWDKVNSAMPDNGDSTKYKYIRTKKYTVLAGIVLHHYGLDGKELEGNKNKPSIIMFPTYVLGKTIDDMISTQVKLDGSTQIITDLFNNDMIGRECGLMITIKKGDGYGYDLTAAVDENTKRSQKYDPKHQYPEDTVELLSNPLESILMFGYDHENNKPFSVKTFNEIKASLLLKGQKLGVFESTPKNTEPKKEVSDVPKPDVNPNDLPF